MLAQNGPVTAIDLKLKVSTGHIIEQFTQWSIGLYSGARDLLLDLKKSCRLAALTNTNEFHWPRILHEFQLPQYFTEIFASHQIELAKPDPAIYRHVIEALGVSPQRVLLFDDNPDNVAAANKLGFISRRVSSLAQIERQLLEFGLLAKRVLKK